MRSAAIAIGLSALASGASAQDREVQIGDLLGRDATEVSDRLGLIGQPPWLPYLGATLDGQPVAILRADTRESSDCAGGVQLRSGDRDTYPELFVFVDGRLATVARPPPLPAPLPADFSPEEFAAARRRPAGALPLASGVGPYVAGLAARGFRRDESLRLSCLPPTASTAPPPPPSVAQSVLTAPLALATLAWFSPYLATRPFETADRAVAAREGRALLAKARLGEPLPGPSPLVRWHTSPATPDYVVATINLGGGREGAVRDFVSVGVRRGLVEWIGPANSSMGLCQDDRGWTTTARKGCTETGTYRP
ncbi:MAG: hypothetical protein ABW360_14950 [Phenylobacterium sp.]